METIAHWIGQYGYFGIFSLLMLGIVGVPVPDETLLTFAGYLVFKGRMHFIPTYAAAVLGSTCGITVSYGLGRSLGVLVIHRYGHSLHITQERLARVHQWFERVGTWSLLVGYFVPGLRHLIAIVAGTSRLRPLLFALFAYTGACVWVLAFVSLGYLGGEEWERVLRQIQRHQVTAALIGLGLLSLSVFFRYGPKWFKRS
jgi:membrane protein DedA with SNARE-associated domain